MARLNLLNNFRYVMNFTGRLDPYAPILLLRYYSDQAMPQSQWSTSETKLYNHMRTQRTNVSQPNQTKQSHSHVLKLVMSPSWTLALAVYCTDSVSIRPTIWRAKVEVTPPPFHRPGRYQGTIYSRWNKLARDIYWIKGAVLQLFNRQKPDHITIVGKCVVVGGFNATVT